MNIILLNNSNKPLYEQIYEQIAAQILNGELATDFCLPSIRDFAKELAISVITVKKAYEMLEQDELIYTRIGKGCFVTEYSDKNLKNKKKLLATQQLQKDLTYYKSLGLTKEELLELIKREYN